MDKKAYKLQCAVADVIAIAGGIFVGKKVTDVSGNKAIGIAAGVTTTAATGTIMNNVIAKKHGVKAFEDLDDMQDKEAEQPMPVEEVE